LRAPVVTRIAATATAPATRANHQTIGCIATQVLIRVAERQGHRNAYENGSRAADQRATQKAEQQRSQTPDPERHPFVLGVGVEEREPEEQRREVEGGRSGLRQHRH